jgi:hypothetical protein
MKNEYWNQIESYIIENENETKLQVFYFII